MQIVQKAEFTQHLKKNICCDISEENMKK